MIAIYAYDIPGLFSGRKIMISVRLSILTKVRNEGSASRAGRKITGIMRDLVVHYRAAPSAHVIPLFTGMENIMTHVIQIK